MTARVLAALAAALVAGVAVIVAASAVLDLTWDPQMAVAQLVAAVFLCQFLIVAAFVNPPRTEPIERARTQETHR